MTVYNGSRWLNDSLSSVLSQTFTDGTFELSVYNDASTVSTWIARPQRMQLALYTYPSLSLAFGVRRG